MKRRNLHTTPRPAVPCPDPGAPLRISSNGRQRGHSGTCMKAHLKQLENNCFHKERPLHFSSSLRLPGRRAGAQILVFTEPGPRTSLAG